MLELIFSFDNGGKLPVFVEEKVNCDE